jgi:hypothetical protein
VRRCARDGGAVNGEEQTMGSRANKVGASGYASGELGRFAGFMANQRQRPMDGRP